MQNLKLILHIFINCLANMRFFAEITAKTCKFTNRLASHNKQTKIN